MKPKPSKAGGGLCLPAALGHWSPGPCLAGWVCRQRPSTCIELRAEGRAHTHTCIRTCVHTHAYTHILTPRLAELSWPERPAVLAHTQFGVIRTEPSALRHIMPQLGPCTSPWGKTTNGRMCQDDAPVGARIAGRTRQANEKSKRRAWSGRLPLQVEGCAAARSVEWADLTLPYFNAVLKESMRLHPVAGAGTVR